MCPGQTRRIHDFSMEYFGNMTWHSNLGSQTASGVVRTCMGDRRHPCPFGAASDYNIFYYFSLDNNKLKTIKCLWKHEYLFISWLSLIIQRQPIALRVASIPQPWLGVRSAGLMWGPVHRADVGSGPPGAGCLTGLNVGSTFIYLGLIEAHYRHKNPTKNPTSLGFINYSAF